MKKLFIVFVLFGTTAIHAKKIINGVEKTVVFVGMVGDMFHAGHVNILKNARNFGDYLIVGVTSDDDAQSYKRVPILTFEERKAVVAACKYVDEVVREPLHMSKEFIVDHGIDVVVHGDDMSEKTLRIFYQGPMDMGILKVLPYTPGISTSQIIQRILARAQEFQMERSNKAAHLGAKK